MIRKTIILVFLLALVGGVSAVTQTFYDVNDGYLSQTTDSNWSTIRNGTGENVVNDNANYVIAGDLLASAVTDTYNYNRRGITTVNTSGISPLIRSATLSVYVFSKGVGMGGFNYSVINTSAAEVDGNFAASDYSKTDFTRLSYPIENASIATGSWLTFTLNPAGVNHINKTANTTFMFASGCDTDFCTPVWANIGNSYLYLYSKQKSAGIYSPYLTVESYTAPDGAYSVEALQGTITGKFPNGTVIASSVAGVNDTAVIQSTLENATAGSTISFTGDFTLNTRVIVTKNMSFIKTGVANFQYNPPNGYGAFRATGSLKSTANVTQDIPIGSTVIPVNSTTGVTTNDFILIYDNTIWDTGTYPTWKDGESHKISSISGNNITITDPIDIGYLKSQNAEVEIYSPITVTFDGLNITAPWDSSDTIGVQLLYTVDSSFINGSIKDTHTAAIVAQNSINVTISNNTMFTTVQDDGYGVSISDATSFATIANNTLSRFGHGVTLGGTTVKGISRGTLVYNNFFNDSSFDAHSGVYNVTITNNTITKTSTGVSSYGAEIGAVYATVANNTITIDPSSNNGGIIPRGTRTDRDWYIKWNTFIDNPIAFYANGAASGARWNYVQYCGNSITGGDDIVQNPDGSIYHLDYAEVCGGAFVPAASFTKSRPLVVIPQSMYINDTSTNTPTMWNISWGDGGWSNSTENGNQSHIYRRPGTFTIGLTVSNAAGTSTSTNNLRVTSRRLTVNPYNAGYYSCGDFTYSVSREISESERIELEQKLMYLCYNIGG